MCLRAGIPDVGSLFQIMVKARDFTPSSLPDKQQLIPIYDRLDELAFVTAIKRGTIKNAMKTGHISKIMNTAKLLAVSVLLAAGVLMAPAQNVAIKTNLLTDAALLTANLGVEVGLAPKWTLDVSGNVNAWELSDGKKWKHWLVQPEARYWFCQRFSGHFIGAHVLGGQFNIGHINLPFKFLGTDFRELKDYRWQGWMVGAGVVYGYTWILSKKWSLEGEIGLGWIYSRHDTFRCRGCGKRVKENTPHNYVGPTKAAINIVYNF